tara:strand:- start:58342 stop:58752 length:411 start_codon:yes stop_codon:yes gene_type:complete
MCNCIAPSRAQAHYRDLESHCLVQGSQNFRLLDSLSSLRGKVALCRFPGHKLRMPAWISTLWNLLVDLPSRILIGMVRLYQIFLSPLIGQQCRFHPTCSRYFIQAVQKYGAIRGSLKGVWRICRCHPFNPGGHDPP